MSLQKETLNAKETDTVVIPGTSTHTSTEISASELAATLLITIIGFLFSNFLLTRSSYRALKPYLEQSNALSFLPPVAQEPALYISISAFCAAFFLFLIPAVLFPEIKTWLLNKREKTIVTVDNIRIRHRQILLIVYLLLFAAIAYGVYVFIPTDSTLFLLILGGLFALYVIFMKTASLLSVFSALYLLLIFGVTSVYMVMNPEHFHLTDNRVEKPTLTVETHDPDNPFSQPSNIRKYGDFLVITSGEQEILLYVGNVITIKEKKSVVPPEEQPAE